MICIFITKYNYLKQAIILIMALILFSMPFTLDLMPFTLESSDEIFSSTLFDDAFVKFFSTSAKVLTEFFWFSANKVMLEAMFAERCFFCLRLF